MAGEVAEAALETRSLADMAPLEAEASAAMAPLDAADTSSLVTAGAWWWTWVQKHSEALPSKDSRKNKNAKFLEEAPELDLSPLEGTEEVPLESRGGRGRSAMKTCSWMGMIRPFLSMISQLVMPMNSTWISAAVSLALKGFESFLMLVGSTIWKELTMPPTVRCPILKGLKNLMLDGHNDLTESAMLSALMGLESLIPGGPVLWDD